VNLKNRPRLSASAVVSPPFGAWGLLITLIQLDSSLLSHTFSKKTGKVTPFFSFKKVNRKCDFQETSATILKI